MVASSLTRYAKLVALSHSVFALPFALWGFVLGLRDEQSFNQSEKLFWVIVAVVSARTAAMAFNRYVDRYIDAQNPRTAQREIPQGVVKPIEAVLLTLTSSAVFLIAAWQLNNLCRLLAPIALIVLLGYSYTKRFTALSHYFLGVALGLAPVGSYLAIRESFSWPIVLIGCAVALWVGGFDILYALQDEIFDRQMGLYSIPALLGEKNARQIALTSHVLAITILGVIGYMLYEKVSQWIIYGIGWLLFSAFVIRQHWISREKSLINRAFFTNNGIASVLFGTLSIIASLSQLPQGS
ncbi:MAG: putative 4-hydroxybenzoate polyprenyltransferase [Bacteroidia bacterium]|nr:putative 4-hydroxybenzoate polyprenyltransferase [Bacteroidia bacterium]